MGHPPDAIGRAEDRTDPAARQGLRRRDLSLDCLGFHPMYNALQSIAMSVQIVAARRDFPLRACQEEAFTCR